MTDKVRPATELEAEVRAINATDAGHGERSDSANASTYSLFPLPRRIRLAAAMQTWAARS